MEEVVGAMADVLDGATVEVADGDMEVVDGAQDTEAGDGVQDIAVAVAAAGAVVEEADHREVHEPLQVIISIY